MIPKEMRRHLNEYLFSFPDSQALCVIDNTLVTGLHEALNRNSTTAYCLSGSLVQDADQDSQPSPYLIRLDKNSALTDWLFDRWGQHAGIYCVIEHTVSMNVICDYFKHLQMAKIPGDKEQPLHFYKPRSLGHYLSGCKPESVKHMLGPIRLYIMESDEEWVVQRYWPGKDGVEFEQSRFEPIPPNRNRATIYRERTERKCKPGSGCC